MKKLISIGVVIAILATMVVALPISASIPPEPPPPNFSEKSFYYSGLGLYVTGGVIAYGKQDPYTYNNKVKLQALVYATVVLPWNTYAIIKAGTELRIHSTPVNELKATVQKVIYALDPPPTNPYNINLVASEKPGYSECTGGGAILSVQSNFCRFDKVYAVEFLVTTTPYIADVAIVRPSLFAQILTIIDIGLKLSTLLTLF